MKAARFILVTAGLVAATVMAPAARAQWQYEGKTFDCVGRSAGKSSAKVYCYVKNKRASTIIETTLTFTITGPVARLYVGRKKDCWLIDAEETRFDDGVVACPGIPKWW